MRSLLIFCGHLVITRAMFILIDNYDSFTWNLVQYFGTLGAEIDVYRNDQITTQELIQKQPDGIILSPGPGTPDDSGICLDSIKIAADHKIPLLGICLGHQAIGQCFGGKVIRGPKPVHGKCSDIQHENTGVFTGLPQNLSVTRYHSLIVELSSLPDELTVTAKSDDGIIMGLMHKTLPIHGVQFHPESIATAHGHDLLKNFIALSQQKAAA